jgi:hypothetical protein
MTEEKKDVPMLVRHAYDVDSFEILDCLKSKYKEHEEVFPPKFFIEQENALLQFLSSEGLSKYKYEKSRNFVIPSNFDIYNRFLGYKLLCMDSLRIEPFLTYQSTLFMGNISVERENFIGLLEFHVYDLIQPYILPDEQNRLEKIVNWLERNRVFLYNKAFSLDEADLDEASSNKRKVIMSQEFAFLLYEKLTCFFEGQETQLHKLLIKNEASELLRFNGRNNQLAELFKRLRYNGVIQSTYSVLIDWLLENFAAPNKQGKFDSLKRNTIEDVFKNSHNEPPKGRRILAEIAKYIPPSERKRGAK